MANQTLRRMADLIAWLESPASGVLPGTLARMRLPIILMALVWGAQRGSRVISGDMAIWNRLSLFMLPIALATGARRHGRPDCGSDEVGAQEGVKAAAALQRYMDQVEEMLKEPDLRASDAGAECWKAVSVETLETLRYLDGSGKGLLLRFLHDEGLIDTDRARVDLVTANLSKAVLKGANLGWGSLRRVDLTGADLSGAILIEASLIGADLSRAILSSACLGSADLRGACIEGVDLSGADLRECDLRMTNLRGANLGDADLRMADLSGADLSRANLSGAVLSEADLTGANLSGATVNPGQLAHAKPLELAVMPNGTRHDQALCPSSC